MEFRLLGPLEVHDGPRRVRIARPRARQVLGLLLLNANNPVSIERLVDEIWGPEPPAAAKASLHNQVSALRKALGSGLLLASGAGYVLRVDPGQVDALRFERLVAGAQAAPLAA